MLSFKQFCESQDYQRIKRKKQINQKPLTAKLKSMRLAESAVSEDAAILPTQDLVIWLLSALPEYISIEMDKDGLDISFVEVDNK